MAGEPPNPSSPAIGRLETIDLRAVWADEARDFTPWILANPDVLQEVLGVEVELERAEHPVGGYSLDIHGRDLTNGCVLIVENQLEGATTRISGSF